MEVGDRVFGKITYVSSSGFTVVWEIPGFSTCNAGQSRLDKFRLLLAKADTALKFYGIDEDLQNEIDKALKD